MGRRRTGFLSIVVIVALAGSSVLPQDTSLTIEQVDTNGDGAINFTDFLDFAGSYNQTVVSDPSVKAFDYDESGIVDFPDFLIFVSFFGQTYEVEVLQSIVSISPDSVSVGQPAIFRYAIASSSIPSGCDVFSSDSEFIPVPDSLVTSRTGTFFEGGMLKSEFRLDVFSEGTYSFIHTLHACKRTFRDTVALTILPSG